MVSFAKVQIDNNKKTSNIETLRNGKQIKLMFGFNWLAGMRCVNFAYLQVGDVVDEFGKVRDIIELTPEKNKGSKTNGLSGKNISYIANLKLITYTNLIKSMIFQKMVFTTKMNL